MADCGGVLSCIGHNFVGELGTPPVGLMLEPSELAFVPATAK